MLKATFKNFRTMKDNRYTLVQIDPKTMKRQISYGGLNVLQLSEELAKNTRCGFLSIVLPLGFDDMAIFKREAELRTSRLSYDEIMQLIKEEAR